MAVAHEDVQDEMPETGEPGELVLPGGVEFRPPLRPLPPLLFHEHRAGLLGMPHLAQNLGAMLPGLGVKGRLRLTAEPVDPLFGGHRRIDKGAILAAVEPELALVRPALEGDPKSSRTARL